jgi:peptidyl-prolyl cis-trans isomerase B (cyclophilin B)
MGIRIWRWAAPGLCLLAAALLLTVPAHWKGSDNCLVDIDLDGYGTITVALDGQAAPETVENFVFLAKSGFYDGLTIYRAVEGFLIEGGAGPARAVRQRPSGENLPKTAWTTPLPHPRRHFHGRGEDYNSASSQFFIVQEDSTYLDGSYAAFGYVVSGMEIVDQICRQAKSADHSGYLARDQQPVISSVSLRNQ